MSQQKPLELKFDANTIDDLGAKLYSTLPPILAELIANGYDAGASEIHLELYDDPSESKRIVISDNGIGMSYSEINDNYLLVGRKKRENDSEKVDPKFGRPVMGKKGLGKLSFFGITDRAEISTVKDAKRVTFIMDRNKIREGNEYYPDFNISDSDDKSGTKVELFEVKRDSNFDIQSLKNSISNYFVFDDKFKVFISCNSGDFEEISNDTRFKQLDVQFSWKFPSDKFPNDMDIRGEVFTTEKPIQKKLRGIALISRKKLVNLPQLFPIDTSSFFFEYLTGYLEVDFIDDFPEDLISTDRKSLNWESPLLSPLKNWLSDVFSKLETPWRALRKSASSEKIKSDPRVIEVFKTIKVEDAKDDFANSVKILADAEVATEEAIKIVSKMTGQYPEFHRQYLTPELRELTFPYYQREEYYDAVMKGAILFIAKLRAKAANSKDNEYNLINKALHEDRGILNVTKAYDSYVNKHLKLIQRWRLKLSHLFW